MLQGQGGRLQEPYFAVLAFLTPQGPCASSPASSQPFCLCGLGLTTVKAISALPGAQGFS